MEILCWVVFLYVLAIVGRMILSWFPGSGGVVEDVGRFLVRVTEPVLAPVRRRVPPVGGLDLSPLIVLLVLQIVVMQLILGCTGPL